LTRSTSSRLWGRSVIALLGLSTILASSPARANFPGENGMIAFVVVPNFGDTFDISVVQPDGTGLQQLTSTGDALDPAWSADGQQIAFHRLDQGIWVMNADGSGMHQVSKVGRTPAWSPDGS
jgi:hypothetical protein